MSLAGPLMQSNFTGEERYRRVAWTCKAKKQVDPSTKTQTWFCPPRPSCMSLYQWFSNWVPWKPWGSNNLSCFNSVAWFLPTFFFFLTATPVAYGISQSRGRIGAAAVPYATATATPDPSWICDLHCRSWQHQILNPLVESQDWTPILTEALGP